MTLKGTAKRDSKWHKRWEKKRLRRERIRKSHDQQYRYDNKDTVETKKAEKHYQEAIKREASKKAPFFLVRWFNKIKTKIVRLWLL